MSHEINDSDILKTFEPQVWSFAKHFHISAENAQSVFLWRSVVTNTFFCCIDFLPSIVFNYYFFIQVKTSPILFLQPCFVQSENAGEYSFYQHSWWLLCMNYTFPAHCFNLFLNVLSFPSFYIELFILRGTFVWNIAKVKNILKIPDRCLSIRSYVCWS